MLGWSFSKLYVMSFKWYHLIQKLKPENRSCSALGGTLDSTLPRCHCNSPCTNHDLFCSCKKLANKQSARASHKDIKVKKNKNKTTTTPCASFIWNLNIWLLATRNLFTSTSSFLNAVNKLACSTLSAFQLSLSSSCWHRPIWLSGPLHLLFTIKPMSRFHTS